MTGSWKGWIAAVLAGAFLAAAGCAGDPEATHIEKLPDAFQAFATKKPPAKKPGERPRPAKPVVVKPRVVPKSKPAEARKPVVTKPAPKPRKAEDPLMALFKTKKPTEPKKPVVTPKPGVPKPQEPKKPAVTPKPVVTPKPEEPKPAEPRKPEEPLVTPKPQEPKKPEDPDAPPDDPTKPELPEMKTLVTPTVPVEPAKDKQEGDEDGVAELPQEILEYKEEQGTSFLDFNWVEMQPRVGLAIFSEDYHIDPSPVVSILARVPMPWLTPGSDGEYFGAWADVTLLPQVERDLTPEPESPTGSPVFFSAGVDFTFLRNQSLYWMVRYGGQYATYGGITNLTEGFGQMAGMHLGIYMGAGITMTFGSDVAIGNAGDNIMLNYLGMLIEF